MSASTSASTPTLWATASKEWVLPPKPKPGRKPKKEAPAAKPKEQEPEDGDPQGRRVQNRAAQRAFRERKQSQLADLQAKIQQYEQGEIERSVALQNIAKRLKAENDTLRQQNAMLLARLNALENPGNNVPSPSQPNIRGKKRGRDSPSPTPPPALHRNSTVGAKRAKKGDSYIQDQARSLSPLLSIASTPDDFDTPPPVEAPSFPVVATTNTVSNVPQNSMQRRFKPLDCGLCSVNTPCACRELGLRDDEDNSMSFSRTVLPPINIESPDQKPLPSILDNLPPFQPAVPLRRRGAGRSSGTNSLFPVVAAEPSNSSDPAPNCSGDPKNCPACAGDTFGQAFCAELSVKTRCDDCPGEDTCSSRHGESSATVVPPSAVSEAVPTNEAWRQLKSHPNIAFADLSMLADVVARRSKCTGAVVRLSPHPDETDPGSRHNTPTSTVKATEDDTKPVLVPQEVLLRCGGQRQIRTVDAAGVRDALSILDSKFSRTWD